MTEFDAFKYFSSVLIMHEICSVAILSLMLLKTKSLKSGGEEFNKKFLIYSFV